MSQGVLVCCEQVDGVFRKITFEALSEGKRIAKQMDTTLEAVVLGGENIEAAAAALAQYGADRIRVAADTAFAEYVTDTYTNAVAEVIAKQDPAVVILGASSRGKDLAARLSARLQCALVMDCIDIRVQGDDLIAVRPMYGGKVLAEVALQGAPQLVAIRPNAMRIEKAHGKGLVEMLTLDTGETRVKIVEKKLETGKVELTEADVVISGGRGMGGPDYTAIETLADLLNGAVGASRSAVDEGWRPHSDQVGQTGKVVSPHLYIACGISGAVQHFAGMSSSKVVVAINKDPEAPIFSKADYGIVGDLFEVVPMLTREIEKIKGS